MERLMKVTGKGALQLRPDRICLNIKIEGIKKSYEKAVKEAAEELNEITKVLVGAGVEEKDIKSEDFSVKTDYEDEYLDGTRYREFKGYKFHHRLRAEFPLDNELLGKVIYAVGHSAVVPEFDIDYTIKDVERAKRKLLAKAIADAREKAMILSEAAGVKLGNIVNIDYSWGEVELRTMNDYKMCMAPSSEIGSAGAYNFNINPDDIDVEDTVTVLWEII